MHKEKITIEVGNLRINALVDSQLTAITKLGQITDVEISEHHEIHNVLTKIVRSKIPEELLPPTQKQLNYANNIAKDLRIELPEKAKRRQLECEMFLNKHAAIHSNQVTFKCMIKDIIKPYLPRARKIAKGATAIDMLEEGKTEDQVRKHFDVVNWRTVENYILAFKAFDPTGLSEETANIGFLSVLIKSGLVPEEHLAWDLAQMNPNLSGETDFQIFNPKVLTTQIMTDCCDIKMH
ncbi:hypothetical protein VCR15J2_390124 [Vibrio coralliirubri]|uniref:hypothetical protein n=1 Tax=Vibrio coralliirubri TaxID=1516159 RepID=UPI0006395DE9|nr:hypothetical protein [Vibrio coralliirubri]CDT54039.1 hypothetical protein VCR15J2_390124 [Vibrio coralliirubri]